jgi:hypothetical protein
MRSLCFLYTFSFIKFYIKYIRKSFILFYYFSIVGKILYFFISSSAIFTAALN